MAACTLHNYLRCKSEAHNIYIPQEMLDTEDPETHEIRPGQWRQRASEGWTKLSRQGSNHYSRKSKNIRNEFCTFFNSDGAVNWQWDIV